MKKTITLAFIMSCLFLGSMFGQEKERNCSSMDNLEYRQSLDPTLQQRMADIEAYTQKKIKNMQQNKIVGNIITIPVVVHVLYSNSQENISVAQIQSQIDVINEDFRRTNSDADNAWSQAADTQIEFCLATVDPNGNPTNGITRKSSSITSWGTNDRMKRSSQGGVDPWNASEYLNMWVCNIGGGILGYAQFPGGSAATDGIVMSPQYFGSSAKGSGFYLSAPFDLGRTTTHEIGHFLNLRHIWGDSNCGNDFVSDTPTHQTSNGGCQIGKVSCGSTDMVQNYMDYSDDDCMNLFTQGQTDRMRVTLLPGGVRASLGASDKCGTVTPPTCSDGIQNGNETGVDCGGPDCDPCQSGCSDNEVTISITLDNYPEETSWTLTNSSSTVVASGSYSAANPDGSTVTEELCLPDDCYTFTINDDYGDGICCSYGNGSYSVTGPSGTVASGGSFGSTESTNFCLGGTSGPTCTDGIQNGNETGVDCGGPDCAPCSPGGNDVLSESYFESGWDGWIDGGSDSFRYSGSRSAEGSYSIRIRDNSGTASSMTSPSYNLTSYDQVQVEFSFYPNSMENGEDFWLRFNNGSGWTTVETWARGTDFNNGVFYTATVTLNASQYNFGSSSQFRFQCDASANGDQVYIDEVVITGIGAGAKSKGNSLVATRTLDTGNDPLDEFTIYPNPVKGNTLYVNVLEASNASYRIINTLGQTLRRGKLSNEINISNLKSGIYLLEVNDGDEVITKKFLKQ